MPKLYFFNLGEIRTNTVECKPIWLESDFYWLKLHSMLTPLRYYSWGFTSWWRSLHPYHGPNPTSRTCNPNQVKSKIRKKTFLQPTKIQVIDLNQNWNQHSNIAWCVTTSQLPKGENRPALHPAQFCLQGRWVYRGAINRLFWIRSYFDKIV